MNHEAEIIYVPELARIMGRTEAALRGAINRGAGWVPPSFKMGHRIAWRRHDVDAWFAKQAQQTRR